MVDESRPCPSCGTAIAARYTRCGVCATVLEERAAAEPIRRRATIVTSDLKGSTALGERLDPESLREVLTTYFDEMRGIFESNGGTIEKIIGDAIVAVFGIPRAAADDALRGVEAAAESQRALAALNDRLEQRWGVRLTVRTGVATGEVVVGEAEAGQHILTGPALEIATAMEQNAPSQEVLLAESTYRELAGVVEATAFGPVSPKGSDLELEAYQLNSVPERERQADDVRTGDDGGQICAVCGDDNPDEFTTCGTCGASLARVAPARETRKTVTIVFADPKPATLDGTPPSPEAIGDIMTRYFAAMQAALERHGATVEKFIGDAVMAVFGLPVRHEDDALRAVRAASEMQAVLPALNAEFERDWRVTLHNHIGVNTGEVVAGDASLGQRLVTGDTVNVAARLEQAAGAREILLGDLTYRLVRGATTVEEVEPLTLKGKSEPVPAYRLLSVAAAGEGMERRQDAPMVGRETEMRRLGEMLATASVERVCRMATVVGDAGVGKSRLIAEFTAAQAEHATVIRGRCLPYGEGITFWPLREAARDAAGIGNDDPQEIALRKLAERIPDAEVADRIASVIGLSETPYPVPEVFWGARRFLEGLARDRPVLLVVDDIHWAEATFLELIGHLVEAVEGAPVLVLCTSRHDLLELHPDWALDEHSLRLVLQPLTDADSGLVVEGLLGGTGIASAVQARIVQAAAGNPLFVEQLLSMLIDDGSLRQADGQWEQVRDLSSLDVPPSIQALVAARLDLLDRAERTVIEPASVIGQNFAQAALEVLTPDEVRPDVPDHLQGLARKQLVQPNPVSETDGTTFRFQHLLVRDAAYNGLLKRARAELHERFVDWAEEINIRQGRVQEFEEIQGYHLEQAYRYLTELGTLDDHARQLGARASLKLASAGRRAMARGDMPAAANLLRRAAATRMAADPDRLRLLPDLGEALEELGEFDEAQRVLNEAIATARELGDQALAAEAEMVLLSVKLYLGEEDGWAEAVDVAVSSARPIFEAARDDIGLTRANRLLFASHASAMRLGLATEAAERVIAHAQAAKDQRLERRGAMAYAQAALYGPTPVPEAIAQCERLVTSAAGDRRTQALLQTWLAQLYAMNGELDRARTTYAAASAMIAELREGEASLLRPSTEQAQIELLGGDLATAEEALRRDYDALTAIGERYILSGVVGLLAKVLVAESRTDEVDDLTATLEELAAPDDVAAQVDWRGLRALSRVAQGKLDEAEQLAREAVELALTAEGPVLQAEAFERLAAVQRAAGNAAAADATLLEAIRRYRDKGEVVSVARLTRSG